MSEIITIRADEILPSSEALLVAQGVRVTEKAPLRVAELAERAQTLFGELAQPSAIIREVTATEFAPIYAGMGRNESPGPIEALFPHSDRLALFALTVGEAVCRKISDLFSDHEYALGALVDSAASEGADAASRRLEQIYEGRWRGNGEMPDSSIVLSYSPGYCGWHISAQRALFEALQPEQIGITLRESFLMEPIKSISGVLIAGARDLHMFNSVYPFCRQCHSQPCRARIAALRQT
jgi:hypothetical protein